MHEQAVLYFSLWLGFPVWPSLFFIFFLFLDLDRICFYLIMSGALRFGSTGGRLPGLLINASIWTVLPV